MSTDIGIRALDEQILLTVNRVLGGLVQKDIDVLETKMKIATAKESRLATGERCQFQDPCVDQFLLVGILSIGVRRLDNHARAMLRGGMKHGETVVHAGRPVIQTPNDMTMNVDQACMRWRPQHGHGVIRSRALWSNPDV